MSKGYRAMKDYDETCYLDGELRVERSGYEFQVRQVQTDRLVAVCLSRKLADEVALRLQMYEKLSEQNEELLQQGEELSKQYMEFLDGNEKLSKRNKELSEQSVELAKQYDALLDQNDVLSEQNEALLKTLKGVPQL